MSCNWNMPGYYFSDLNRAMISENPLDSVSLSWAYAQSKMASLGGSFWAPNFNFCPWSFGNPLTGLEFLCDPSLAWQQAQAQTAMQNQWMMPMCDSFNGGYGGFGNYSPYGYGSTGAGGFSDFGMSNIGPMGGMGGFNPWAFPTAGNVGGAGAAGKTPAEAQAQTEYNELAKSVRSIMNIKGLDASTKTALQSALNTKGTIAEKKAALKEAVNQIGSDVLQEYVLLQYRADLDKIGYNFGAKSLSHADTENWKSAIDVTVGKFIDDLQSELKQGKDVQSISMIVAPGENYKYLIPSIAHWNRNNNEHIIQYITKGFSSKDEDGKRRVLLTICGQFGLGTALCDKARRLSSSTPELDKAKTRLKNALDKVDMKNYKASQETLNEIAAAFDNLYGQIRMVEAQNLRNKIMNANGYSDLGIIDENFIVADVQNDLKNEKINCSYDKIAPKKKERPAVVSQESELDKKSADDQIKTLINNKTLTKTKNEDIYKSKDGKYYTKAQDKDGNEILSEVKGITSISEDGKINGKYETVADAQDAKAVTTQKRTASYVQNIENTMTLKQKLIDNHLIHEVDGKLRAYNKDKNNNPVFYKIDEYGQLVNAGNNHVVIDEDSDEIPKSDTYKNAKAERQAAANAEAEKDSPKVTENQKSDSSEITKGDCVRTPVIGYYKYKNGNKYFYENENGGWEYLDGVTSINKFGLAKKNGKNILLREAESPEQSGEKLYSKLNKWSLTRTNDDIDMIIRKLNSFATYTDIEDIMKFIGAQVSWYNSGNLCKLIVHNDKLSLGSKKKHIQNIAIQIKKVVDEMKIFNYDDEEYRKLEKYVGSAYWAKIEDVANFSFTKEDLNFAAEDLDSIISKVKKKYKEKTENNTK